MSAFCGNSDCPSNWAALPCTCPPETWQERADALGKALKANAITSDGLDGLLAEVLASPDAPDLTSEQELLVALTELIAEAQHGPSCYIDPDETVCHCLIGKVKAVLPLCKARKTAYGHPAELDRLGEPPEPYWQCVLIEHPDNPDKHHFGEA